MASRTMVTVGTDGFRDYVDLPDGRTFNLGSTSILRFVVELAENQRVARKALDQFLKSQSTMLAVDMGAMIELLQAKRSRWAGHKNRLMATAGQSPMTFDVDQIQARLSEAESLVASVSQAGTCDLKTAENLVQVVASIFKSASTDRLGYVDEDLKEELALYLDSESRLNSAKKGVLQNILRKVDADKYDVHQAWKLWMFWVDEGAKMYTRQFKVEKNFFPKDLRESLAKDIARQEKKRIDEGEYTQIKTAVDLPSPTASATPAPAPPPMPVYHPAPPPMVAPGVTDQEQVAIAAMAQVETAFKAVQASKKVNTELAKKDLFTISSMILEAVKEGSDAGAHLSDLADKAAKIEKHFST